MSNPRRTRLFATGSSTSCSRWAIAAFCAVMGSAAALDAGSIFMKNGYIIQGPIVERNDGEIVLGWPNGKILIHRRFVDSIVYEQAEEKRLAEDEAHHAKEAQVGEESPLQLESLGESEDLPSDIDAIMTKYVINTKASTGATDPTQGTTDPSTGQGDGQQGTVSIVPRPDASLGDRVTEASLQVSFKPPKGWTTGLKSGVLEAAGSSSSGALRPSINVATVSKGPLDRNEYSVVLKDEDARLLRDFEVLSEGARDIGAEKAHEVIGRGVRAGHTASLRQMVVEKGGTVWLVSVFVPMQGGDAVLAEVEESLKTFEFGAR